MVVALMVVMMVEAELVVATEAAVVAVVAAAQLKKKKVKKATQNPMKPDIKRLVENLSLVGSISCDCKTYPESMYITS